MVKHTAHNSKAVGSNPTKFNMIPSLYKKLYSQYYFYAQKNIAFLKDNRKLKFLLQTNKPFKTIPHQDTSHRNVKLKINFKFITVQNCFMGLITEYFYLTPKRFFNNELIFVTTVTMEIKPNKFFISNLFKLFNYYKILAISINNELYHGDIVKILYSLNYVKTKLTVFKCLLKNFKNLKK